MQNKPTKLSAERQRARSMFVLVTMTIVSLAAIVATSGVATADHTGGHDSTQENMTRLKSESVEAFADGVPDIFEMILLAVAISALIVVINLAWRFTKH